jgi:hypothetical protein
MEFFLYFSQCFRVSVVQKVFIPFLTITPSRKIGKFLPVGAAGIYKSAA